jgi:hypothetical protein
MDYKAVTSAWREQDALEQRLARLRNATLALVEAPIEGRRMAKSGLMAQVALCDLALSTFKYAQHPFPLAIRLKESIRQAKAALARADADELLAIGLKYGTGYRA